MATLLSLKRMASSNDSFYNSSLRAALGDDAATTGAKTTSWGGTFKTDFINRVKSAKSVNSNFNAFDDFKILSQSAIRSNIGYQVIFDPATPSGADYYVFTPTGGVGRGNSPWEAKANWSGGQIPYPGNTLADVTGGAINVNPGEFEWFTDGTNFIYWDGSTATWYSAGDERKAPEFFYFDGGRWASLLEYYAANRWTLGEEALFGFRAWNNSNLTF